VLGVSEERPHLTEKILVPGAGLLEKAVTLARRAGERGVVRLFDPLEARRFHHLSIRGMSASMAVPRPRLQARSNCVTPCDEVVATPPSRSIGEKASRG